MKTNLRITKFMIFCISAYILLPKIAACTDIFSTASANALGATSSNTLIARKVNSQNLKDIYIPPNYGGPDSHNGSGTR
ncbi:hypothetical protein [Nostoc sp. 'Lobaria pulmonaria (5183) cyanobiont']|uniref:hypothetical protein n=1 Tax=Nostoc sp. 'Lobaria pulmonaria (5183) cyanobiont' TaxID=1618022 RepID=UPI000CF33084|nr:hypothetical protein [Nostoc sp. 'Lobaria pulmonaria (5183) cyanobiont']AVH70522.1 hypothetical protein NLP_1769 [Nostoc sp. 'Lobaria pulmonaria (5183) cyanobiont']